MSDSAAFHAVVQGRVQGVNYRAFASRDVARLGLAGYMRNLPDGSVEICAEGNRKQLEKLIEQLKAGPPGARVDNLALTWADCTGQYSYFSVRR
jgi:acylphosphatase